MTNNQLKLNLAILVVSAVISFVTSTLLCKLFTKTFDDLDVFRSGATEHVLDERF